MKTKNIVRLFAALVIFLGLVFSGVFIPWNGANAAAYDAPETEYTNTVVDRAWVSFTNPNTLMLAGAYGQYNEQFKFHCPLNSNTMNLYYDVKDIQGQQPALGVSGFMIEYYPKGVTEMGNGKVIYDSVTGYGGEGLTFRQVIDKLTKYKDGNFVINFYTNDGTFDHMQNAYSLMYPVTQVAGAIKEKMAKYPNFCKSAVYIGNIEPFDN